MKTRMPGLRCMLAPALLAACADSGHNVQPAVPAAIQPPAGQSLLLRAHAVGAQVYVCRAGQQDPAGYDWVLKAPDAQLSNRSGKPIIKHFEGPTWQATDGSSVVGELVAKDTGPDPLAIPWLLLKAKSNSGAGLLGRTQSIQRIDTVGGRAPAGGCNATLAGSEVRVHYTADYLFYGAPR
jgi:hypothetical protein